MLRPAPRLPSPLIAMLPQYMFCARMSVPDPDPVQRLVFPGSPLVRAGVLGHQLSDVCALQGPTRLVFGAFQPHLHGAEAKG